MAASDRAGIWWTGLTTSALQLGAVHALVDLASGFLIFKQLGRTTLDYRTVVMLVVLYNSLAFGLQVPLGLLVDRARAYRSSSVAGVLLAAAALLVAPRAIFAAIVVVGVGNALYHLGAGGQVLDASGERATESGVFVGPGAAGLCAGILLGVRQVRCDWAVAVALVACVPLLVGLARTVERQHAPTVLPRIEARLLVVAGLSAACLFGSVTVRSLVGGAVAGSWRGVSLPVTIALAVAACAGKMTGGALSDRIGWATTSVAALLVSLPLVSILATTPAAAIVGMLFFQMTMPVTLKAVHNVLPTRPALAFGVPCLALLLGALPDLLGHGQLLRPATVVAVLVAVSTLLVAAGLWLLGRAGAHVGPTRPPFPDGRR
jgi:FSR family fosmidomycin resistance protein-like MFS transporter